MIVGILFSSPFLKAQDIPKEYFDLVKKGDSLYNIKQFEKSAKMYSSAFKVNKWKGLPNDRYNAACSWAMANVPDSAFFNLERVAKMMGYNNYAHIIKDSDLIGLHNDKRWNPLIELVKQNKEKADANLNKPLVAKLDSIHYDDQTYRYQAQEFQKKYGWDSKELKDVHAILRTKDSINLIQVTAILDKYGWLGSDIIGDAGNNTLFLVIQHSDLKTQEKYLPMLKEAVKNGKASGVGLAMLEDRIEMRNGRKQIYGSQIGIDLITKDYYVVALVDPENVDKRRASVGLPTMEMYLTNWNLKWDLEQYKKDLPKLEAKLIDFISK